MEPNEFSNLTDQELLAEAKKVKSASLNSAFFIGIAIGIVIYSVAKNGWGFLTLILLYVVYKIINDPKKKRNEALEQALKERNLK
jgi:membrane protein insertase Oxa1/YidC/SpoIIIJ